MKNTTIILVGLSWFKPKKSEFQEKKFYVPAIAYNILV
jgi:hypothetical protein